MLVKSVTSNKMRIFIVANNLQPVRKVLNRLCHPICYSKG